MKGDDIPKTDSISRYCPYSRLSEITGKPTGAAFQLKTKDIQSEIQPHISVNWLEYFDGKERANQIEEIRIILSKKMKIGTQAKLALLNVGAIYRKFESSEYSPRVLHWPDHTDYYDDPSHAGIFDVESDPDVIADMIAQIDSELIPAKFYQAF